MSRSRQTGLRRYASRLWWQAILRRDHTRLLLATVICVLPSVVGPVLFGFGDALSSDPPLQFTVVGLAFNLAYFTLSWLAFREASPDATQRWATHQKGRPRNRLWRWFVGEVTGVDFIVSIAIFAVLSAVVMIRSDDAGSSYLGLGSLGIVTAWLVLHLSFALTYARHYYTTGGLTFPDEPRPDVMDFAYLSYTIGTTFASVDVRITDRRIRRIVLIHSVLSFAFNTVLLGLVVTFLAR